MSKSPQRKNFKNLKNSKKVRGNRSNPRSNSDEQYRQLQAKNTKAKTERDTKIKARVSKKAKAVEDIKHKQALTQAKETELIHLKGKDEHIQQLTNVIENTDATELPKLTGILNTNKGILEVLTKMYKSSNSQDTSITLPEDNSDTLDNLSDRIDNLENRPERAPKKTKEEPKNKPSGFSLKSILGGSFTSAMGGLLFGRLLKFSPLGTIVKSVKFLTKIMSKGTIGALKYLGKVGLKSLKSIVKFVKGVLPYSKDIMKTLMNLVKVGKVAKVGKSLAEKSAKVVTKAGAKVAPKIASKIALKAGANIGGRLATASVPIAGWVASVGLAGMDAQEGWKGAGETLGVDKEELSVTNKASGSLASVLTLGIGSKSLAKDINKNLGGVESTYIKRYENKNVIEYNSAFRSSTVNFNKFNNLSSNEMKEVFTINDFSFQDMSKMETIITNKIKEEQTTLSKDVNNLVVNKETNNTFSKIVSNRHDMNKNYIYNKDKIDTSYVNSMYGVPNNTVATTYKEEKEQLVQENSKEFIREEVAKNSQLNAQLQQTNIQNTQVHEADKETSGSDRILNLFDNLTGQ